jgi:hypothetical protein
MTTEQFPLVPYDKASIRHFDGPVCQLYQATPRLIISRRHLLRVTINATRNPQPKQSGPKSTTMMNCDSSLIAVP